MRKKIHIFLVILIFLTSCTAYIDTKREAGAVENVGQSTKDVIALCYNPIFDDEEERFEIAQQACESKKAIFTDTRYFNCSLFYPNTAFYKCN